MIDEGNAAPKQSATDANRGLDREFDHAPHEFAMEYVDRLDIDMRTMLLFCLAHMSHDDIRDMLDVNELSPRFRKDDES